MALNDLLSRVTTIPGLTNPPLNAEYTWVQLDANLKIIYDALVALSFGGVGNIKPWNAVDDFTNANPDYVSIAGNIYRCIVASSINENPTLTPASWELVSIGELAHAQNTDNYLAFGTANQVSAVIAAELINNQFISVTEATFGFMVSGGLLKTNRIYKITDSFPIFLVHSHGGKLFSKNGWALIRTPNILNIWKSNTFGGTYSAGQKVNFDGYVYTNLLGANTDTIPSSDLTNWAISAESSSDYKDSYFETQLSYSSGAFGAYQYRCHVTHNTFNYIGMLLRGYPSIRTENTRNICDDWSDLFVANANCIILGNMLRNSSGISIGDNSEGGLLGVQNNVLDRSSIECLFPMQGDIANSRLTNTKLEFPAGIYPFGLIDQCTFTFARYNTILEVRADCNLQGFTINDLGSDAEDVISIPAGVMDLEENGVNDVYGIYSFVGGDGATNRASGFKNLFPVKVYCDEPGSKLTVSIIARGDVAADGEYISTTLPAGDYDMESNNNEYLILKQVMVSNGFDAILVEVVKAL